MRFGKMKVYGGGLAVLAALVVGVMAAGHATAQIVVPQEQSGGPLEEIVVTARKRDESIMRAPVLVQAITAQQLEDLHLNDMYSLSAVTPGLEIVAAFATVGAEVSLRGLSNGFAANFIDQSVLLNLDGAGLSHGAFYRGGLFDVAQIEVLKGPQALFFGKSSDAGIVAVHSADPTDTWETKISGGHEFVADETDFDGYVSGPLTDKLGIRLAGYWNSMAGYLYNPNPAGSDRRLPDGDDGGGRLTLKYDDREIGLRAKLKIGFTKQANNAWDGGINQRLCATGRNQTPGYAPYDNCTLDTTTSGNPSSVPYRPDLNFNPFNAAAFAVGSPSSLTQRGNAYQFTNTVDSTLDIEYDVRPGLTLTSVSAWTFVHAQESGRDFQPVINVFDLGASAIQHEFSEELRLTSNWKDSWINFMVGGLYNPGTFSTHLLINTPTVPIPGLGTLGLYTLDSLELSDKTGGAFGQLLLTPIDHWELSAGVRYTNVHKYFTSLVAANNYPAFFFPGPSGQGIQNVPEANKSIEQHNLSPEVTLTYRPTDLLTGFASFKRGYKGPGFNANTTATSYNATQINPFGGETVKGFEGGVKAQLLDRHLALTATAYRYNYIGLQVAFPDLATNTVNINNGANARIQGAELGVDFVPRGLESLTLSTFVNYNDAYYTSFPVAPCYGNQSPAAGCLTSAGGSQYQNLTGRALAVAPKWTGNISGTYHAGITDKYVASLDLHAKFSGRYNAMSELHPLSWQSSYFTFDSALHFAPRTGAWDLAFIGRNLTNKIYIAGAEDGGAVTPGVISDAVVFINRPRQLMLQLTVYPSRFQ